jgi:pyrroline-5-carboxylate reductase
VSTIGFIGSGNMAEAIIKGVIAAGLYKPENILVSDISDARLDLLARTYRVIPVKTNADLARKARTVVLSVKPQNIADALDSIADALPPGTLVLSIAAGVKVAKISDALGDVPIVRAMPNTPALIGQGATALFANQRAKPLLEKALALFSSVGKAVVLDDEDLIDAVTAVSGSGPAYYFLMMEEMINAASALGLPPAVAQNLVLQTAKGAGLLADHAQKNNETPADLRRKVTSPGGTTEAALKVLAARNFSRLMADAITAARDRSTELSP